MPAILQPPLAGRHQDCGREPPEYASHERARHLRMTEVNLVELGKREVRQCPAVWRMSAAAG